MPTRYLLDSCVVIDYLRRRTEAADFMRKMTVRPFLSTIVVAEVFAGIREGQERLSLERLISGCRILELTQEIAVLGGLLAREHRKRSGTSLNDALIAATALSTETQLVTCNTRHFPMLPDLIKPY